MEGRKRTQEGKWAGLHPSAGVFWPAGRMFGSPGVEQTKDAELKLLVDLTENMKLFR